MKHIIQAVVVAALFTSTQAKAEDPMIVLPSQWTHADGIKQGASASAFPGSAREDPIVVESKSTRADRYAAGMKQEPAIVAFPGFAREDPIVVESKSTYADQFVTERNVQARGASDPALSQ